MKIRSIRKIIFALGLFALASCTQDQIFYMISQETPPLKPRIPGSPTNMVKFDVGGVPLLFVASTRLNWYDGSSGWNSDVYDIEQPKGQWITSLAATNGYLYALTMTSLQGINSKLWRSDTGKDWKEVIGDSSYPFMQSLFTANDRVFVGTRNSNNDYVILHGDGNSLGTLTLARLDTNDATKGGNLAMLSGAAEQNGEYFLSTQDPGDPDISHISGIFQLLSDGATVKRQTDNSTGRPNDNRSFMGMIQLEDTANTIIVVERDGGGLFKVDSSGFERMLWDDGATVETGRYAMGSLALWEHPSPDGTTATKLLVAGIQQSLTTSSQTYGYVEFELNDNDGSFKSDSTEKRRDPGRLLSIYGDLNQDRYRATIGIQPLNHLFQAPWDIDNNMTFFASTNNSGLWSYRNRESDGGWQWNAED